MSVYVTLAAMKVVLLPKLVLGFSQFSTHQSVIGLSITYVGERECPKKEDSILLYFTVIGVCVCVCVCVCV